MYVSEKDIDTLNAFTNMIQGVLENGPDDEEYWQQLSADAYKLFIKAKRTYYKQIDNRTKNR